jgi:hypothetical protein
VYVDVVLNHMTGNHENAVGVGGSTADTFNLQYPAVPFGPTDFNEPTCGINNYGDAANVSNDNSDFQVDVYCSCVVCKFSVCQVRLFHLRIGFPDETRNLLLLFRKCRRTSYHKIGDW